MASYRGLQEKLEELQRMQNEGSISSEEHDNAIKNVLSTFGLGDAGVSTTGKSGGIHRDENDQDSGRGRRVEILIHNLSHSDMALSVNTKNCSLPIGTIKARPLFGQYRDISEKLLNIITENKIESNSKNSNSSSSSSSSSIPTIRQTSYSRNPNRSDQQRYQSNNNNNNIPISSGSSGHASDKNLGLPLGFDLSKHTLAVNQSKLHFKGGNFDALNTLRNASTTSSSSSSSGSSSGNDGGLKTESTSTISTESTLPEKEQCCYIDGCYFPLLSVLVHKWLEQLESNGNLNESRKIIILVSGRGMPTDPNARSVDNSTKATSKLVSEGKGMK